MLSITDLIEEDYREVFFKHKGNDFSIKVKGITAYDIALMWKENVLRDVLVYIFDHVDLTDSAEIYHQLLAKAPLLMSTIISLCDFEEKATPILVKRMPMSAQLECFNHIINLTFNQEENSKIEEELKKLVAEARQLMKLFYKKEENKN